MSVEKVEAYREQKKHRKENLAKERRRKKRNRILGVVIAAALVCGLAGALGLTAYNQYEAVQAAKPDYTSTTQIISDYTGVLSAEDVLEGEEVDGIEVITEEDETEAETESQAE